MSVTAILGIVSTILSIGTSIQGFVDSVQASSTADDDLSRSEREDLSQVLAAMTLVPDTIGEMRGIIQDEQATIDGRPGLSRALDVALVTTRTNIELIQGRLETIDFSGKGKLSDGDVDDLRKLLRTVMNSQDLAKDGASESSNARRVLESLDRNNLFALAILMDNVAWFAADPGNDIDALRNKLGDGNIPARFVVDGSLVTEVRTTDQLLGG